MCSSAVLKYMETTNRPYSVNDVFQNLHNAYSKSAIQKALDELTANGKVREKIYGKQKVYCIVQLDGSIDNDEVAAINSNIETASEELTKLENELKTAEATLKAITMYPKTDELRIRNEELTKTKETLAAKLNTLKSGGCLISKEDREKIQKRHDTMAKESRKRKRWLSDLLDAVLENYPKSKAALIEEIGLEM